MSHAPAGKAPAEAGLYERDLYAWSLEQARLLQARRFGEIDAENIAEEIRDLGKTEYRVLESALRILLTHMLKWDYQPEKRTRSWQSTISVQRRHALEQLAENPSLKSRFEEAVGKVYRDARDIASGETNLGLDRFPEACPFDWNTITKRPCELRD